MTESDYNSVNNRQEDEYKMVKHSVRHKQKERVIRKKRKKVNRLRAVSRLAVFLVVIYSIYKFFTLTGWYLPQDTFKNPSSDRIQIVNNKIVPTYILNQSMKDVKVSQFPIFMMRTKAVKRALYGLPTTKKVYVRRYGFPARLQIIIKERIPVAIIKTSLTAKPSAFFTSDNVLISNKKYMNLDDYSSVLNIITTPQSLKKEINAAKIHEIEEIVKYVETYSGEKVEYIDMRIPNDVYVKIKTTSIRLGVLDSTIEERIKRIYTILPQISNVNSEIKYIDLSWDKVNYLKLKKN
jgi:cell division septal protein FtsQ